MSRCAASDAPLGGVSPDRSIDLWQLRRAVASFLKAHPLVARFEAAPMDQGGAGVTVVELKD